MTFGILEAAGGIGVGLLVNAIATSTKKYSTVPQDFREGNQDLQLAFDSVEKYGKLFEPDVQEEFQDRYKELVPRVQTACDVTDSQPKWQTS
jgi:hypothetical protein